MSIFSRFRRTPQRPALTMDDEIPPLTSRAARRDEATRRDDTAAPMRVRRGSEPQAPETTDDDLVMQRLANMWDGFDEGPAPAPVAAALPAPTQAAGERVKTRLLGHDETAAVGSDVFEAAGPAPKAELLRFPVGWIVIVDGPGRGTGYTLRAGVSQIGRGEDETIALNFGDLSISRSNHASIAYDEENHEFLIGHGGKLNVVRLNGKPVLSTERLTHGDLIRIGETTLRFIGLCDPSFNWQSGLMSPAQGPSGDA